MAVIEDKLERAFLLKIKVKTNSKEKKIVYNKNTDSMITIHLISKPIKNKANKELIRLLSKKLNVSTNQIQIIAGLKSENKTIRIKFYDDISEQILLKKLKN